MDISFTVNGTAKSVAGPETATLLDILRNRLRLPSSELDSVLRMIRSQIHLSLVRHLGGPADNVTDDAVELDPSEVEEDG